MLVDTAISSQFSIELGALEAGFDAQNGKTRRKAVCTQLTLVTLYLFAQIKLS
jgi:hypothetical protein